MGHGRGAGRPARAGVVSLPGPAVRIAAGTGHTCAVLADGGLYCWGAGLGVRPRAVPLVTDAVDVAVSTHVLSDENSAGTIWETAEGATIVRRRDGSLIAFTSSARDYAPNDGRCSGLLAIATRDPAAAIAVGAGSGGEARLCALTRGALACALANGDQIGAVSIGPAIGNAPSDPPAPPATAAND